MIVCLIAAMNTLASYFPAGDVRADVLAAYARDNPRSVEPQWFDPDEWTDFWVDLLFVTDILIYFRTAYFVNDVKASLGTAEMATQELGSGAIQIVQYRIFGDEANGIPSTGFVVLLIGCVPWDRLFPGMPYLRLVKCIRVERMLAVMPFVEVLMERGTMVFPALKPVAELIITIGVAMALCHVMSCFLYFAGHPMWEALGDGSGDGSVFACEDAGTCGWVTQVFLSDETMSDRYYTAFYYSFTIMATVGFGDISASNPYERILTMLTMAIGAL